MTEPTTHTLDVAGAVLTYDVHEPETTVDHRLRATGVRIVPAIGAEGEGDGPSRWRGVGGPPRR